MGLASVPDPRQDARVFIILRPAALGPTCHPPDGSMGPGALGALSWPPTPASQLPAGAGRQRGPGFHQTHTALLVSV